MSFLLADFLAVEREEPLGEAERCEPDDVLLPDFAVEADSLTRLAEWWVVVCEPELDFCAGAVDRVDVGAWDFCGAPDFSVFAGFLGVEC